MSIHKAIYEKLIEVAKEERTIPYGEIAPLAELDMSDQGDRNKIADILGEISTFEHHQGRPMLSALVVLKDKGYPGEGFFTLARYLGLHKGQSEFDDLEFFVREVQKVHEQWKAPKST